MSSDPHSASDATMITEFLGRFEEEGFTGQLAARDGGQVVCFSCHEERPADEFELAEMGRTEGASDPSDMLAIAAITCPCGARGTVVLGYGPDASLADMETLKLLS